MKLTVAAVQHVARLAELAVSDAQAARLTSELERIVTFVAALDALDDDVTAHAVVVGPAAVTLREDMVDPIPLAHPPAAFAPTMVDGFFVVPKLDGLAEE